MTEYMMFMAHIPCKDISYVETELLHNCSGKYLIAPEYDPYQHLHFIAEMTKTGYHAFSKRVFKDKYKLRGRATKDNPRQYGKVKEINDISRALIYTCKYYNDHPEECKSNMTKRELEDYASKSFKKDKKYDAKTKYVDYLKNQSIPHNQTASILVKHWLNVLPDHRPPPP